jgi:SsrA-binding protein
MKVTNRTWQREFIPIEEVEAGVVLNGSEAKSAHEGRIKLEASYVKIKRHEVFLLNTEIFRYKFNGNKEYNATRERKLLLKRKEILRLESKMASSPRLTIVPIAMFSEGRLIKVKIALVSGRNDTQKRKLEKGKEIQRKQQKEMKEYMKK